MNVRPPIQIVIADAGPLISLASADRLDLLDAFDRPIKILDVVKEECLRKTGSPGEAELARWFTARGDTVEIVGSPVLALYEAARAREISGAEPYAAEGLGDAAISWFLAKLPRLYGPDVTSLVLTEDATFGNMRLGRNVHVLSTRPFLATLEALRVIPSASAILREIAGSGRIVARYQADRPALVGRNKTSKTQWTGAIRKPRPTES